eukprot:m.386369 g.386369  ORF g.386369 m.386369 type:complete len:352 (+) comp20053_c0_seq15:1119-2174(+)
MNPDYDYLIKITLAGDCRTGKSSLMRRYTEDTFSDTYEATTGTQFKVRRMEVDGKVTKQQIWDRAGEQRFGTITESYRGAHCIFVLYDVTSELSWQSVPRWLARVTEQASRNAVVVLVGNKVDREDERCVTSDEARMFAEEHGLVFTEVSAKSAHNVEGVFLTAMQTWIQKNSQASSQQGASASKANKKVARARYGLSHEAPTNSVGSSIGKLFTRIVKQKAARNLHVHQHSSGGKEIVGLIRKRRGGWPHVWQTNWLKLDRCWCGPASGLTWRRRYVCTTARRRTTKQLPAGSGIFCRRRSTSSTPASRCKKNLLTTPRGSLGLFGGHWSTRACPCMSICLPRLPSSFFG